MLDGDGASLVVWPIPVPVSEERLVAEPGEDAEVGGVDEASAVGGLEVIREMGVADEELV